MNEQKIIQADDNYRALDEYFAKENIHKILLVCDRSISLLNINSYFLELEARLGITVVRFDRFTPNPLYEQVCEGVDLFNEKYCDMIVAVGGGSAMDVAKCIKLFSNMNKCNNYLMQNIVSNDIELLAVPTTAGTGSEATRYAVIYYGGEKQSIAHHSCIPQTVLFDVSALKTLPIYQKKATMMDAFCHALESFWSVNSTDESKGYSVIAIREILINKDGYLSNNDRANERMLYAANLAGKAINITQTTAGHAMCYKLTSLYGIAHGHAAALCVAKLWPYMLENISKCVDIRGMEYLNRMFDELAGVFGCDSCTDACQKYESFLKELELLPPIISDEDYKLLTESVNPVRLKNNPIKLDENSIYMLYHEILKR